MKEIPLHNRDLSWLAFSHRVLQEAADANVPLYERIRFLAIFSSNLDEFFRVRVASIRSLAVLKKKTKKQLEFDPEKLLKRIHKVVTAQQEEFGDIYRNKMLPELARHGIMLVRETDLSQQQQVFVKDFFNEQVKPHIVPVFLSADKEPAFLENRQIYLAVVLQRKGGVAGSDRTQCAIVEIPTTKVKRFVVLPAEGNTHEVMFLDDIVRYALPAIFPMHDMSGAFSIKLTRDAELDLGDELSGDLVDKIKKAIEKRRQGLPSRLLYDNQMPSEMLDLLQQVYGLSEDDLIEGARYHNFSDFWDFPNIEIPGTTYESIPPIIPSELDGSILPLVLRKDVLLYYPYHSYEPVIRFLREAAEDPSVVSIKITLYRVGRNSRVVEQLLNAIRRGKQVSAFVELKARFDEESNIRWAEELERSGAKVYYSFPNLKVHAKLCLVTRHTDDGVERLAYLSTGNFNESVARGYTDFGYFTADERLTSEVEQVFEILCRNTKEAEFKHLLVAPYNMRDEFERMLRIEMKHARKGKEAFLIAKMNSLEDTDMIERLYEASDAGVKIRLIVRGICCLVPGVKGLSENITMVSIVDRYLEHARVYWFHQGGNNAVYLASADWMRRNLSRRIEVAFPIYDESLRRQIRSMLDLQLGDNVKGRLIDEALSNTYMRNGEDPVRSQYAMYDLLKGRL